MEHRVTRNEINKLTFLTNKLTTLISYILQTIFWDWSEWRWCRYIEINFDSSNPVFHLFPVANPENWKLKHLNKINRNISRLDRSLLTFTEINQLIRLIHMYRQLDGYYHEMSDQLLDGLENRLQGLMTESNITQYEKKN